MSVGVSCDVCRPGDRAEGPDGTGKQATFADEHKLSYPVLSDETGVARKAYGVEKGLMGMSEGKWSSFGGGLDL